MKKLRETVWEYTKVIVGALLIAGFVRVMIFEPYKIPSSSMVPTLLVGDYLFVSKYVYGPRIPYTTTFLWQRQPKRGDVIVFRRNDGTLPGSFFGLGDTFFIKRVIGLPGDKVAYKGKQLIINGKPVEQIHRDDYTYADNGRAVHAELKEERLMGIDHDILLQENRQGLDVAETTVPPERFIVMGDNRDNSRDARYWNYPDWGYVPRSDIAGRAEFILWSLDGWVPRIERFFNTLRPAREPIVPDAKGEISGVADFERPIPAPQNTDISPSTP